MRHAQARDTTGDAVPDRRPGLLPTQPRCRKDVTRPIAGTGYSPPVREVECAERLALDVFNTGARQITLGDVEHYLGQLASHSPECRCGRCQAAAIVRPDRGLMIVRCWQRQARQTRLRALR